MKIAKNTAPAASVTANYGKQFAGPLRLSRSGTRQWSGGEASLDHRGTGQGWEAELDQIALGKVIQALERAAPLESQDEQRTFFKMNHLTILDCLAKPGGYIQTIELSNCRH